jgi:hypothetical protein
MVCGLLGGLRPCSLFAQSAEPALWIAPHQVAPSKPVVQRIYRALSKRGAVTTEEDPSLPPDGTIDLITVREAITAGLNALYEPDIPKATEELEKAFALLSIHPRLVLSRHLSVQEVQKAMLNLARSYLVQERKQEAITVVNWLIDMWPSFRPHASDFPRAVIHLVSERISQGNQDSATIAWPSPEPNCQIHVNGQPRTIIRLAPGRYVLQMHCGRKRSPLESITVEEGIVYELAPPRMLVSIAANRGGEMTWLQAMPKNGPEALSAYLERPIASLTIKSNPTGLETIEVFRHNPNGTHTVLATTTGLSLDESMTNGSKNWMGSEPTLYESNSAELFWTWVLAGSGAALLATGGVLHGIHNQFVDDVTGSPTASEAEDAYGYRASSITFYASGATALAASILFYFIEGETDEAMLSTSPSGYPGFSASW